MPWVISLSIDSDKMAAPAVGTATATFTDTDGTTFTFAQRAQLTAANATAFRDAAIAARDAWQNLKTTETNMMNTLVSDFNAVAGESATAAKATG